MVNLMQSSNDPSQQQSDPQYNDNPYSVGMPHSLIAATMYEGSVRNFNSNSVSSDIMSKSKSSKTIKHIDSININNATNSYKSYIDHLLEEKRANDYHSWNDDRVSKYTACSNIIANEISHLYNRDDLNFDDWQYLILYNKFKKILTEKGTCSAEIITYLIYNLINMVKNDLTLRNLLMISSDDYVEEVLTKFVEMALNQRIYGYEYAKSNAETYGTKSARKHLQRTSVAASVANTVSKSWGWKDTEQSCAVQAPSELKPENYYVYGRHLKESDENININDGCIPIPKVVYRKNDIKINKKETCACQKPYVCETQYNYETPYSSNKLFDKQYTHDTVYSGETVETDKKQPVSNIQTVSSLNEQSTDKENKRKNSRRCGPRGPYKRTLIRMRMREISKMRRHIKQKENESFFLNSEFDDSVKNIDNESNEKENKQNKTKIQINEDDEKEKMIKNDQPENNKSEKISRTRSGRNIKPKEYEEYVKTFEDENIINTKKINETLKNNKIKNNKTNKTTENQNSQIIKNNEKNIDIINEITNKTLKTNNSKKIIEWTTNSKTNSIYTYYTNIQEGYIDPHMIYSSNASTNNSISSSPIANDYFHEIQNTHFSNEVTEDYNYQKMPYGINIHNPINKIKNREFLYYEDTNKNMTFNNKIKKYNELFSSQSQDPIGKELKKYESEVPSLIKYTSKSPYHSKPVPESINEKKKSTRINKLKKVTKETEKEKINNSLKKNINIEKDKIKNTKNINEEKKIINENEQINKENIESEKNEKKTENTIWDMVQKHQKSNYNIKPIIAKNSINTNNEPVDEKDDMSLLIKEHYHISENVPSSQTLPFPNAYKNPKCIKWSYTETKRFYNAIETFGTDLLLVRAFLPEFTDRQVYDKFKLEERKNPQLIQNALQTHKSISLKQYEQKHGKIDIKTHYNPHTDPLLQGESIATKSGLQLNPDISDSFESDTQPKVDDKIINLFM